MSVAFDKHAPSQKGSLFVYLNLVFGKFLLLPEQQRLECCERIRQLDNKNRTVRAIQIGGCHCPERLKAWHGESRAATDLFRASLACARPFMIGKRV